ncbi:MAG TPA: cation-translocating P-type ATPase [Microthrixaceae bacterium]|nr:cation-translocating P-type ATPase [Microthrixaceae bacterium]
MPSPPETGLTSAEVADRVARGLVNAVPPAPSRTVGEILRANIFTRFNLLMGVLLAIVLACRAWRDALFGIVVVANALIGIVQEIRAKRTLDHLAVLSAPKALLVRDGAVVEAGVDDIVLDDVIELRPGGQVVADADVLLGESLEIDESLLTGESDPVVKEPGDSLMSGSFVVAGGGRARVTKVGADAYAARLAEQARRFTLSRSALRKAIDRIITWVSWAIVPTGIVLFWSQLASEHDAREALVAATGGVVAMVPEGLILLTSVAFAVGVVRMARKRTLVQELPAIEILARVDVLCLDKTGTITEGSMQLSEVIPLGESAAPDAALAAVAWADPNPNATQLALQERYDAAPDGWRVDDTVPFSSARKWSATSFEGHGSWVLGAPEMVMAAQTAEQGADVSARVQREAELGRRVLLLAHSDAPLAAETLPAALVPIALVSIEDRIRPDAAATLEYFAEQGVTLKVISGDNPVTVGAVAARAGLPNAEDLIDARTLPEDGTEALADIVEGTTVFGRVSPHQKQAMVGALQSRDHVVAMTGDGVNDVLALKDADVGIAMASGSEATRSVAQLVLLDSNFSGLPPVVDEGRKIINNIQRVAAVFLTKTVYAILLALVVGFSGITYPFLPRHLTLISTATIGLPGFFLALEPNTDRVTGEFLRRVGSIAVPSGIVAAATTLTAYLYSRSIDTLSLNQERTTATLALAGVGLLVLLRTSHPLNPWKAVLVASMAGLVLLAIITPIGRSFFDLVLPPQRVLWVVAGLVAIAAWLLVLGEALARRVMQHR